MSVHTEDYLATMAFILQRGLQTEPKGLDAMLVEAIRELEPHQPSLDPAENLTLSEREALARGGADTKPDRSPPDQVARGRALYAALLRTALTPDEVASELGVTAGRVRQLLAGRRLLGVQIDGSWRIPAFQLVRTGPSPANARILPGLDVVLAATPPGLHLLTFYRWMTTPQGELSVNEPGSERGLRLSPKEWLEEGRPPEAVAELAATLGI